MPVQLNLNNAQADEEKSIKIIQINLNKSEKAHLEIINNNKSKMRHNANTGTTFNHIQHNTHPSNLQTGIP